MRGYYTMMREADMEKWIDEMERELDRRNRERNKLRELKSRKILGKRIDRKQDREFLRQLHHNY